MIEAAPTIILGFLAPIIIGKLFKVRVPDTVFKIIGPLAAGYKPTRLPGPLETVSEKNELKDTARSPSKNIHYRSSTGLDGIASRGLCRGIFWASCWADSFPCKHLERAASLRVDTLSLEV